jgi:tetratricopeptide (TPR) repeat protein
MSMNALSSPLPSFRLTQPGAVKLGRLFAPLFALGLLFSNPIFAGALHAEMPIAEIAAADRSLGPDAAAYHALQEGRSDAAAALLRATLAANPADATARQLLCRVFYAQDDADNAIHQCELAVSTAPANSEQASDNNLWLGRAYGMKARHAGPIAGFTLARKVVASFTRAVELNSSNVAALNDLGEYYVAAPFLIGGGTDKAHALAARMMPRFPWAAHRLLARLADSGNDLTTAESEFKQAVAAEHSPGAWIDLAQFYQGHARPDDALYAVKSAVAADRAHGPSLVDAASILTAAQRAPDLAERCLRDYLSSRAKSDAAPAFKVHLQLSRLLAARGDTPGADREVAAAAALAPAFTRSARTAQGL